jgi:hypothetical protein
MPTLLGRDSAQHSPETRAQDTNRAVQRVPALTSASGAASNDSNPDEETHEGELQAWLHAKDDNFLLPTLGDVRKILCTYLQDHAQA